MTDDDHDAKKDVMSRLMGDRQRPDRKAHIQEVGDG